MSNPAKSSGPVTLEQLAIRVHTLDLNVPAFAARFHQLRHSLSKRIADQMESRVKGWLPGSEQRHKTLCQQTEEMEVFSVALLPVISECERVMGLIGTCQKAGAAFESDYKDAAVARAVRDRADRARKAVIQLAAETASVDVVASATERVTMIRHRLEQDQAGLECLREICDLRDKLAQDRFETNRTLAEDLSKEIRKWKLAFQLGEDDGLLEILQVELSRLRRRVAVRRALAPQEEYAADRGPHPDSTPSAPTPARTVAPSPTARQLDAGLAECRDWAEAIHQSIDVVLPLMNQRDSLQTRDEARLADLWASCQQLLGELRKEATERRVRMLVAFDRKLWLFSNVCGRNAEVEVAVVPARQAGLLEASDYMLFVSAFGQANEFFHGVANNKSAQLAGAVVDYGTKFRTQLERARQGFRTGKFVVQLIELEQGIPSLPFPTTDAAGLLDLLERCETLGKQFNDAAKELGALQNALTEKRARFEHQLTQLEQLVLAADGADPELKCIRLRLEEKEVWDRTRIIDDQVLELESLGEILNARIAYWYKQAESLETLWMRWVQATRRELALLQSYVPVTKVSRDFEDERPQVVNPEPVPTVAGATARLKVVRAKYEALVGTVSCIAAALSESILPEAANKLRGFAANLRLREEDRSTAQVLLDEWQELPVPNDGASLLRVRQWLDECQTLDLAAAQEPAMRRRIDDARAQLQRIRRSHLDVYHPQLFARVELLLQGLSGPLLDLQQAMEQLAMARCSLHALEQDASRRVAHEVEAHRDSLAERMQTDRDPVLQRHAEALLDELGNAGNDELPNPSIRRRLAQLIRSTPSAGRRER